MSKHTTRRAKARMIRAAARQGPILCEAVGVEWVQAADNAGDVGDAKGGKGDKPKPKRFKMRAYNGGPMRVAGYFDPVVIDLAGITAKPPVAILRDHDLSRVVGHADDVDVAEATIDLAGAISGAGPDATEVVAAAANGFPWKASVGARPDKLEIVGEDIKTKVNGKTFTGPLYVARKSTLGEVSFVAIAADGKTRAKVAASAAQPKEESDMKFEHWIEALGLDLAELRDDQVANLRAKYDAEVKAAEAKATEERAAEIKAAVDEATAKIRGAAAVPAAAAPAAATPEVEVPKFDIAAIDLAHAQHAAVIDATAEQFRPEVSEADWLRDLNAARLSAIQAKGKALEEEWPCLRLETEYIKAQAIFRTKMMQGRRPQGPAIHTSNYDFSLPAIEAAFCKSAGLTKTGLEAQFKPEVLEAADKQYKSLGLHELLLLCAVQNGYSGRMRVSRDNLAEVIRAAFSVHTITTLLSTTGNKLLLEGFQLVPQSWREAAGVRSVSDFKAVTSFRLTAEMEYELVGPGGAIPHGTAGQESQTIQAKTYGKLFSLTRQDIINDDLGAFDDLRTRIGMGAAIAMNKLFWTTWLAAANGGLFWTLARGNYQTGALTALGEVGLNTAVKLYRDAAGPDGNLLGFSPIKLLVPSDLEATARKLYVSQEMRDTTAATTTMTSNIYFNQFKPVVVPELANAAYPGFSATRWFLLCDPALLASATMCFLNGVQAPTIESTDADFNTLGIQSRGWHDFGVDMAEYRASVESEGV